MKLLPHEWSQTRLFLAQTLRLLTCTRPGVRWGKGAGFIPKALPELGRGRWAGAIL